MRLRGLVLSRKLLPGVGRTILETLTIRVFVVRIARAVLVAVAPDVLGLSVAVVPPDLVAPFFLVPGSGSSTRPLRTCEGRSILCPGCSGT